MTSHQYSDRDARTSARRPSVRRGLKKRGVLPSFGDIILPVVGIFAVVLLVIAGRQFFLNGMKTSPGISSTRAYAEAPAVIAEREKKEEAEIFSQTQNINIVSDEIKADLQANANANGSKEEKDDFLTLATPVETLKPEVKQEVKKTVAYTPQVTRKTATSSSSSNAAVKKTQAKTQAQAQAKTAARNTVNPKMWRVQIGAYTNRAGAQEAADKIKKAGYNAIVYSNPASKHFKVWVQGGADKKAAENVVKAMQKLGYKGSFSFPPAK